MSTAVAESPTATQAGAKVVKSSSRTILQTEEFRCGRPTTVAKGGDNPVVPCGAESWVKATYPHGLERYYCAHHAEKEMATLIVTAVELLDERAFINKAASASS